MLAVAALVTLALAGLATRASAKSTTLTYFGTCAFGLSETAGQPANLPPLRATFSPPVTATSALGQTYVTISGTGTCVGNTLVNTVYISLSDYGNLTCQGGEGPLYGYMNWTPYPPSTQTIYIALYFAGPGQFHIVMVGAPDFAGVANLVWSTPGALASCPISGTASTDLSGMMVFGSS